MSLKGRFIVSEKGRMINIICIIIFFILSHLSPSPDPRQGVRPGGPSPGQPVTSGSVWRAEPHGWLVEGDQSFSSLPSLPQATRKGWLFLEGDRSQLPAFPEKRQWHLGLRSARLPFGKGTSLRSQGSIWGESRPSVTWDCTGVGSSSLYDTLLAELEEAVPYMFLQEGTYYHFSYLQYSYILLKLLLGYELLLYGNWMYLFSSVSMY